ncbi:Sec-independent protein translocase protein TATB, chloroplastic [Linum perenne]
MEFASRVNRLYPRSTESKHLGVSFAPNSLHKGRKGKRKGSLFGVGAPEALVIAVVALLVFGPKGLADLNHHNIP